MLTKEFYQTNRKMLASQMEENTFYFCHSGSVKECGHDDAYPFEVYRNFLYLTGIDRSDCMLVIVKKSEEDVREFLFMHIPTPMEQRWQGVTFNRSALVEQTGIANILDINSLESYIARFLFSGFIQDAYMDVERWEFDYTDSAAALFAKKLKDKYPYLHLHNAFPIVSDLRTIKTKEEISCHRKAVAITRDGVLEMMHHMKPGMYEYQIEAYYNFILNMNGVKTPAFPTIAASGINACHMHYMQNNTQTEDDQLILFDLGARWNYYCADVSRTYPVNGKFTERQKELYNVVLKGLKAAEEAAKPGVYKDGLQELSKKVMAEELVRIGKIEKEEDINKYYFHGSGHNIGLDTHDVGDYELTLEKDMMFTLEPGLYFDDEKIGIRIEDTLLVTEDGVEILSNDIPKEIDEIERVMSEKA